MPISYFPLLWLNSGVLSPTPISTEWTCVIVSASKYANGDLKLTMRCPKGAPFIKNSVILVRML